MRMRATLHTARHPLEEFDAFVRGLASVLQHLESFPPQVLHLWAERPCCCCVAVVVSSANPMYTIVPCAKRASPCAQDRPPSASSTEKSPPVGGALPAEDALAHPSAPATQIGVARQGAVQAGAAAAGLQAVPRESGSHPRSAEEPSLNARGG